MSHQIETDLQAIKTELKGFLSSKPQLSDYNFEGSNISALLDVLSYNTYMQNLYLNMAVNEMYLDTALTQEAVRSHAKELNYLPRSRRSAKATVDVSITVNDNATTVIIPKGTAFTTAANNNTSYTFTNDKNVVAVVENGVATAEVDIYEGTFRSEFFVVDTANTSQQFILQNPDVDTDSISVNVRVSQADSANGNYTYASDLFGLTDQSNVFFLQAANQDKYQLLFGNGVTGRALQTGNIIEVNYRVSTGEESNGASIFDVDQISGYANTSAVISTSSSFAQGGALAENVSSIKFNAPRHYQTLHRAVTASDYKTLITSQFPQIRALSVFGGETQSPPKYGRVVISADVANADGISQTLKEQITEYVNTKSPVSIEAEFINPEFLEIELKTTVKYNINTTTLSQSDIATKVRNTITSYNTNNLEDFNKTLRYSRLVSAIDASDPSIIGNVTNIRAIRSVAFQAGIAERFSINFGNTINPDHYPPVGTSYKTYQPGIRSDAFTKNGRTCFLEDDTTGNIQIVNFDNEARNVIENSVGSVNYATGLVTLTNVIIDSYLGAGVKLYAQVEDPNIVVSQNLILQIKDADVTVTVVQERE